MYDSGFVGVSIHYVKPVRNEPGAAYLSQEGLDVIMKYIMANSYNVAANKVNSSETLKG